MPTVSRISILCIPILLLMVILQFDLLLLREHSPSLVPLIPTFHTSHPEVTLSDPGGPLLVSMAEVVMLPPQVLPQPTCSPPPLPRLKSFSSKNHFWKPKSFFFNSLQIPKLLWISRSDWPTSLFPTIRRHDDAFRVWGDNNDGVSLCSWAYSGHFSGWHPGDIIEGTAWLGGQVPSFEIGKIFGLLDFSKMIWRLFLVEATVTHKGHPKPLMWERLKFTPRFAFADFSKVRQREKYKQMDFWKCDLNLFFWRWNMSL